MFFIAVYNRSYKFLSSFTMKCNQNIRLIGQKVLLVPYERCHVPKYHSWMEDPQLRQLTASEPLSLEAEYEMQRKWRDDDDKCTFIILSKDSVDRGLGQIESMVGDVNVFLSKEEDDIESDHSPISQSIAELEIMIAEGEWRGRGLGREAVIMMILYVVESLKISKFQVKIGSSNVTSLKLFETLGFHRVNFSEIFEEVTLACVFGNDSSDLSKLRSQCSFIVDEYKSE